MSIIFKKWISQLKPLIQYNLKLVFAGVFFYFMGAAFLMLFGLITLIAFNADSMPQAEDAFYMLIWPALITMFYPTAYGLQNDMDSRMMEVLIGIPNYRYKVWLFRLAIVFSVIFIMIFIFSAIVDLLFIPLDVWEMTYQLMFPMTFLGMFIFFMSTLVRSGHGTAAVSIIFMLILLFSVEPLEYTKWNVYLNPFELPLNISEMIWMDTIFYNRVILLIGSILTLLGGLFMLQKRHRFI